MTGMRLYGLPFEIASSSLTITEDTPLRLNPSLEPDALRPVFCDGTPALRPTLSFSTLSLGASEFSLSDALPDLSRGYQDLDLRVTLLTDFEQHIQSYSGSSSLLIGGATLESEPTEIAPGILEWVLSVNDMDSFSVDLLAGAAVDLYGRTSAAADSSSQAGLVAQLKAQVVASGYGSYSPPSISRSIISLTAASVATGSQITVSLTGIDAQGSPVTQGGETVAFTLAGGTSAGSFSTVTDHGNGTYSAVFTAGAAGTPAAISGTINGMGVTTTLPSVQVISSTATTLVFSQDITGAPEVGQPLTVEVRALDTYGQVASGFSGAISLTLNSGGNGAILSGTTTLNAVAGVARFTGLSVSQAGAGFAVQAAAAGLTGATGATFGVSTGSPSVAVSTVSLSSSTLTAGGSITVTLTAKNQYGVAIPTGGASVAFSTSPSGVGSFSPVTDQGNGTYTASYSANYMGSADIAGAINGATVTSGSPQVTITAGTATQIQLSNTPSATAAAGAALATAPVLTIRDAYGNLVSDWATAVSAAAYSNANCTTASGVTLVNASVTPTSGIANFTGLTSQGIGVLFLRFTSGALVLCVPTPLSVSIGAPSASQSSVAISGGATTVRTGYPVTATLTVRDIAGNAYSVSPGATVTFSYSGGTGTGTFGSVTDNSNGTYSVTFTGVAGGTPIQVGASINGTAVTSTATLQVRTPLPSNDIWKVLVVGSRIYVGTCGGGLAYSDDGGIHWTVKTTSHGLGHNCVFDIYVDGSTIYAGTKGGFSISTDGGTTWSNKTTANGLGGNEVVGISVLPGGVIYAASRNPINAATVGGPSWSGDYGATWTNTLGGNYLNGVVSGEGFVFTALTGAGGLKRSSSSTIQSPWTWTVVLSAYVTSASIYNGILYASTYYGTFHVSSNYGQSWSAQTLGGGLKETVVSGSTIYVASDLGVNISTDNGTTWTRKTTAHGLGNHVVEDLFLDGTTLYAATPGGLSRSTDGGNSWINITNQ